MIIARLSEWLRRNSEHYLMEAAQAEMAQRYLGRGGPVTRGGLPALFWRRFFVPVYRRLPWKLRRSIILALPGSHRRRWQDRSPPVSEQPSPRPPRPQSRRER